MVPYYLQIGLSERVGALGLEKEEGIPTLSSILGLINISIFEEGNISNIDGLKDKGFPVLCGLGKLPDPSSFYRFLQGVKTTGAEEFIVECSKKFVGTGLNMGRVVNLDGKFLGYFGKKKIGKTKHPTRNIVLPGLNVFAVQDQETRNPLFLRIKYPGLKAIDVGIPLLLEDDGDCRGRMLGEGYLGSVVLCWSAPRLSGQAPEAEIRDDPEDAPEQDPGDERDSSFFSSGRWPLADRLPSRRLTCETMRVR